MLPESIIITNSLNNIVNAAYSKGVAHYICLASYNKDELTVQLEWRKMSIRVNPNTREKSITIDLIFSFVYYYDSTSWSAGPYVIKDRNNNIIRLNKYDAN